jgi:hypothetical protein
VGNSEWHEEGPLPIPGNGRDTRSDVIDEVLEWDLAFVHAERTDMERGVRTFKIQEGRVLGRHSVVKFTGHW